MPQIFKNNRFISLMLNLLLAFIALIIILLLAMPIGFYGMAMYLTPSLPSVAEIKAPKFEMPLQIYSQDYKLIGQYGNRMSLPTAYNEVPDKLVKAFLAAEDSTFFEHSGISIKGLGRAVTEVIMNDENQTGGSTITMQVAKNYFLSPDRTFNRKLTELFLSRRIEAEFTKNEILTLYVNKIYLGEGAYGIKAGAKKYFSKSLDNLTIAEMAMLAGLPKAPSQNNPVTNPEAALIRRNWILDQMLLNNYITQQEHTTAIQAPIGLKPYQVKLDMTMPYLAEMARYALVSRYGDDVMNAGWRIRLTVSSQSQQDADAALKQGLINYDHRHGWRGAEANDESLSKFRAFANILPAKVVKVNYRSFEAQLASGEIISVPWSGMRWAKKFYSTNRTGYQPNSAAQIVNLKDIVRVSLDTETNLWHLIQIPNVQGSLVSLDPNSGAVLALVGGFDFSQSKFNRATQGWRQPGSTIKPLIYTAALVKGYSPDSIIDDSPLQIGNWKPKNSDGRFYGPLPLRKALYLSRNLVSIRLLNAVGTRDARYLLEQFGLDKDKLPTTLSLALGAGQATPLQMATAYSTFANGGHRIQPYYIDSIYNYNSQPIYQARPKQACAECFNKDLEEINASLADDFNNKINDAISDDSHSAQLTIDEALPVQGLNTTYSDTSSDPTEQSAMVNGNELHQQGGVAKERMIYDAAPFSDRLKPTLIQYTTAQQAPRIISSSVAYEMANILRDVIQLGTGRRARSLNRQDIGGKTGTTNEAKDAWFAGFQPTIATVVWVGFDHPKPLGRHEYGGVAALPIWIDYMGSQLKDRPQQWVSMSNKAQSETQRSQVIDITNESISSGENTAPN